MPHSALQAGQYSKWRTGRWPAGKGPGVRVDFTLAKAWDLERLEPNTFFPVPSSVVFAKAPRARGGGEAAGGRGGAVARRGRLCRRGAGDRRRSPTLGVIGGLALTPKLSTPGRYHRAARAVLRPRRLTTPLYRAGGADRHGKPPQGRVRQGAVEEPGPNRDHRSDH